MPENRGMGSKPKYIMYKPLSNGTVPHFRGKKAKRIVWTLSKITPDKVEQFINFDRLTFRKGFAGTPASCIIVFILSFCKKGAFQKMMQLKIYRP